MAKKSAGILAYRRADGKLQVLLVHPGGPYFAKKDLGAWTIPKGEYADDEEPLAAAKRELKEETGHEPEGNFIALAAIVQKGGKEVLAWAVETDIDAAACSSNTFSMEWPPRSGRFADFPEVDKAEWFSIEEAKQKINPAQVGLLEELIGRVSCS